jgi:hypothetical protein
MGGLGRCDGFDALVGFDGFDGLDGLVDFDGVPVPSLYSISVLAYRMVDKRLWG